MITISKLTVGIVLAVIFVLGGCFGWFVAVRGVEASYLRRYISGDLLVDITSKNDDGPNTFLHPTQDLGTIIRKKYAVFCVKWVTTDDISNNAQK